MKVKVKRILSFAVILCLVLGIMPVRDVTVKAAESNDAGTVGQSQKIGYSYPMYKLSGSITLPLVGGGTEKKSTPWRRWQLGGKDGFCLSLGKACSGADTYKVTDVGSYTNNTAGKNGAMGKVIYWYTSGKATKNRWLFAQALFWSIQGGEYSESELKSVISRMKTLTGGFSSQTANQLYSKIFETTDTYEAQYAIWEKNGSATNAHQTLMTVASEEIPVQDYTYMSARLQYYQDMVLHKVNEDGTPMANVKFKISLTSDAQEVSKMQILDANGTVDETESTFDNPEIEGTTDADGYLRVRYYFETETDRYYYYSDVAAESTGFDWDTAMAKLEEDERRYVTNSNGHATQNKTATYLAGILENFLDDVENTYVINEVSTGNNHLVVNPNYTSDKKKFTLKKSNVNGYASYAESQAKWLWMPIASMDGFASGVYDIGGGSDVVNDFKKASIVLKKRNPNAADGKAHGDATLKGGEFRLYTSDACTTLATVYDSTGKSMTCPTYTTDTNGELTTDYLRSGKTYWIKETKAPVGFILDETPKQISVDASGKTTEFTNKMIEVDFPNESIRGKIAIQKYFSGGKTGEIHPEIGAQFQVYLEKKGSYDACDDYDRDFLTIIDESGYVCSKELSYGKYIIHQISTGGHDTEMIDDIEVEINNPDIVETQIKSFVNNEYKFFLLITKKDRNTNQTVLKEGTSYQIYQLDDNDKETLVTQSYSDGHGRKTVDTFTTDASGQIMTVDSLSSGRYRIYEVDSATGLRITKKYIEVEINSKADNYRTYTDEQGNTYTVVEQDYFNDETYGKLSIKKTGEVLTGFEDNKFVYEKKQLKGVELAIYADEDILTQDNQGTKWFEKDALVATVKTGEKAEFTSECGGITGYEVKDGVVTVNLPLGKYRVEEKKTLYGYVLSEKKYTVEFTWDNKDDEFVLNSTAATDENGVLGILNQRAKAAIELLKKDKASEKEIAGAVFGLYTKDAIYNADGEKIVEAGTRLESITTGKDGKAEFSIDLPLMSENYADEMAARQNGGVVSGGAVSAGAVSSGAVESAAELTLNSGDYYVKEESVSGSYYLDETEIPIHLEYQDEQTKTIKKEITAENEQTEALIDKRTLTGSEELAGCDLTISDKEGNQILSWTSGNKDSIKFSDKLSDYVNLSAVLQENGGVLVKGLLHDVEYVLTETRPADGYVTADSITFMVKKSENGSLVSIKGDDDSYTDKMDNKVIMYDDITKFDISKTDIAGSEEIEGCELKVTEKDSGDEVDSWTSTKEKHRIEKLTVGKKYTLTETRPADGYVTADSIDFIVLDTGDVQSVHMVDEQTVIRFLKTASDTGEGLEGAKIEVYDSENKKVLSFTSTSDSFDIKGILAVGATYIFREVSAPTGYDTAEDIKFTVKDTADIQKVTMEDKKKKQKKKRVIKEDETPNVPKTGRETFTFLYLLLAGAVTVSLPSFRRKKRVVKKKD